jgi:hypothetical protein
MTSIGWVCESWGIQMSRFSSLSEITRWRYFEIQIHLACFYFGHVHVGVRLNLALSIMWCGRSPLVERKDQCPASLGKVQHGPGLAWPPLHLVPVLVDSI